jgi:selenium metabolism protein YedF
MRDKVVVFGSDGLGQGDAKLGGLLQANFLRLLGETEAKPKAVVFLNHGVKQVVADSLAFNHLKRLEEQGVEILSCQTCLEYLGLIDHVAVGNITGMAQIIELLSRHQSITL